MTYQKSVSGRKRYRIVVRGEFGEILSSAFVGISAQAQRGMTILTADVADSSEFYGVLDRLRDFAIEVVSVDELPLKT